jgi:hypothetical protein
MPQVAGEPSGKLVVMSSNFAGREFTLDKPAMVIGRTDDNDVVVNHRSISRHHAKIVREHGRYSIVDLQSANGVRVNGEEYGKVELRRGDMIDLGHVRLRFVEAGEDFVFGRDGHVVEVGGKPPKKSKAALFVIAGVVGVGGLIGILAAAGVFSGGKPSASQATVTPPGDVTPPPPDSPTKPVPPNPAGSEVQKHLDEARALIVEEKWDDALAAAKQALKVEPGNAEAKALEEQAKSELKTQGIYDDFVKAAGRNRTAEAAALYRKIPENSAYRPKATGEYERLRNEFVSKYEAEARTLAGKGQCDRIPAIIRKVTDVFPESGGQIEKQAEGCKTVAVVEPGNGTPKDPIPVPPANKPSDAELDAMEAEAQDAAKNGQFGKAMSKAEEVLKWRPGDQDMLTVGGIAACNLKDEAKAARYIGRLKGQRQNMIKQICARNGVSVE